MSVVYLTVSIASMAMLKLLLLSSAICTLHLPLYYLVFIRLPASLRSDWLINIPPKEICPESSAVPYIPSSTWFSEWFANYSEYDAGISRWTSYFRPYDRHFSQFRNKPVVLLEIGVQSGGSINMWRDYFGSELMYYGLDVNKNCQQFSRENVTIYTGDQGNATELRSFGENWPMFDIIIDDGGHSMQQQMISVQALLPKLKTGGVYLIEDLHTSYWKEYGGTSSMDRFTMIERLKMWIDVLNLQHHRNPLFRDDPQNIELHSVLDSMHFYDSMVFILKDAVANNTNIRKGGRWIRK